MSSISIRFGSTGLAIYLGLGVLYHLITSDIPFAWGDPWLYVTMALWPFMLLGWIIAVLIAIFVIWVACQMYDDYFSYESKKRRKNQKLVKIQQAKQAEERERRQKSAPHND